MTKIIVVNRDGAATEIAAQPGLDEEKERPMIFLLRARKPA